MVDFFTQYGAAILRVLVLICWLILLKNSSFQGINSIAVKYFIIFLGLFILWNISMILSKVFIGRAIVIYLIFWAVISIYELFFIVKVLFITLKAQETHSEILTITISILAVPIIVAAILSYTNRSYNPINTTDFYNIILLMLGSVIILRSLLSRESFLENIESFFIFSGFTLYFGLHILASNAFLLSVKLIGYWNFAQYATLISLIYWLGSIFFIWKIRSRHLS